MKYSHYTPKGLIENIYRNNINSRKIHKYWKLDIEKTIYYENIYYYFMNIIKNLLATYLLIYIYCIIYVILYF